MSTSISTSKSNLSHRRKLQGSSIIISSNQLKKYQTNELNQNISPVFVEESSFDHIDQIQESARLELSDRYISTITKLQRWYRHTIRQRKYYYFTQCNRWNQSQAELVLALYLGYKIRKLLKFTELVSLRKDIVEIYRVIIDMLRPLFQNHQIINSIDSIDSIDFYQHTVSLVHKHIPCKATRLMKASDEILLHSLVKQYYQMKVTFYDTIFKDSKTRIIPSLSNKVHIYYDINPPILRKKRCQYYRKQHKHIRNSSIEESFLSINSMSEQSRFDDRSVILEDELSFNNTELNSSTMQIANDTSIVFNSICTRKYDEGHLQINIMSIKRLVPFKRGIIMSRKEHNNLIPFSNSKLRVSLYFPIAYLSDQSITSSSSLESTRKSMKKVYEIIYDYNEALDPISKESIFILLPLPSNFKKVIDNDNIFEKFDHLLEFWSEGLIVLQVLDKELMNHENYLSESTIPLKSFLLPWKQIEISEIKTNMSLELKGNFELKKKKPLNQVFGTIQLHCYLYLPVYEQHHYVETNNTLRSPSNKSVKKDTLKRLMNKFQSPSSGIKSPSNTQTPTSNRIFQLADVSKCLDDISILQESATIVIDDMEKKLQAKILAKDILQTTIKNENIFKEEVVRDISLDSFVDNMRNEQISFLPDDISCISPQQSYSYSSVFESISFDNQSFIHHSFASTAHTHDKLNHYDLLDSVRMSDDDIISQNSNDSLNDEEIIVVNHIGERLSDPSVKLKYSKAIELL